MLLIEAFTIVRESEIDDLFGKLNYTAVSNVNTKFLGWKRTGRKRGHSGGDRKGV